MKVTITSNDFGLKSNLKSNQTLMFTKKSFFSTILGFTQSHFGVLGVIEKFVQLIPGIYSEKPNKTTGIDKNYLKLNCINGSIASGIREPIL